MMGSPTRANPRDISNAISAQNDASIPSGHSLSNFVWQWGQFIDHDITLMETSNAAGAAHILVGDPNDPLYPIIPFTRSDFTITTPGGPREQMNSLTSFIDGSGVYGSDAARSSALRTYADGRLATSSGDLLPFNTSGLANAGGLVSTFFLAGDVRANEQIGLAAMHTLFVREHNRIADLVLAQNAAATDEMIFQTARKLVGAEIQAITYQEFLPALLGINAPTLDNYTGFHAAVNPAIANEFASALYRFGHTMLPPNLLLIDNDGNGSDLALRDAFFNPTLLSNDPTKLDLVLRGLALREAQEIDTMIVDDVRNFLFGAPGSGGMDLASLNIQRGRDSGLADYNTVREAYGLPRVANFSDITANVEIQQTLLTLYGNVDNIDLWVGALAEDHLAESSVGELINASLVDQFTRLRDGDRFFFLNDPDLQDANLLAILDPSAVTLADLITWNTGVTGLPSNVFLVPEPTVAALCLLGSLGLASRRRRKS